MSPKDDFKDGKTLPEQAAAWLVRVQSDAATDEDWAALTDWLDASDLHLQAFETVERTAAEIEAQAPDILAALDQPAPKVLPFAPKPKPPKRHPAPYGLIAASLAGALIIGGGAWTVSQGLTQAYQTGAGQTQAVALADGTHIRLDASTTLSARLGWRARRIALGDGVAAFDVAKDARRPFIVSVGDQQVRVVGTEFNIAHYHKMVVVTVRRGVVRVTQAGLADPLVAQLTKGQELRHIEGTSTSVQSATDPSPAFAWTEGRLICDDQPLSSIVAYLNHRYQTSIQLSPAAAKLKFSGVLELGDQTELVHHLARYLSLSAEKTGQGFLLH